MHCPAIIEAQLALRRAQLALLEVELVTACESAAGHGHRGGLPPVDRSEWDRATWQRYLAAARALDAELGPRMRRLHVEIERLEREASTSAVLPDAA